MSVVRRSTTIAVPRREVWAVVADIGAVPDWNVGVASAACGPMPFGVGTTRTCHLRPGAAIDEVVSVWKPEEELWFAIGRHGAIRSADMGWVLSDVETGLDTSAGTAQATVVEGVADYHLALGPLGPVIDHLSIKRMMTRMLDEALRGLKQHLEHPPTTTEARTS